MSEQQQEYFSVGTVVSPIREPKAELFYEMVFNALNTNAIVPPEAVLVWLTRNAQLLGGPSAAAITICDNRFVTTADREGASTGKMVDLLTGYEVTTEITIAITTVIDLLAIGKAAGELAKESENAP